MSACRCCAPVSELAATRRQAQQRLVQRPTSSIVSLTFDKVGFELCVDEKGSASGTIPSQAVAWLPPSIVFLACGKLGKNLHDESW